MIPLARKGNYLWVFTNGMKKERKQLFQECGFLEHSGIQFLPYRNIFSALLHILKKKPNKKYDVIITRNKSIRTIMSLFHYTCVSEIDEERINELQFAHSYE